MGLAAAGMGTCCQECSCGCFTPQTCVYCECGHLRSRHVARLARHVSCARMAAAPVATLAVAPATVPERAADVSAAYSLLHPASDDGLMNSHAGDHGMINSADLAKILKEASGKNIGPDHIDALIAEMNQARGPSPRTAKPVPASASHRLSLCCCPCINVRRSRLGF